MDVIQSGPARKSEQATAHKVTAAQQLLAARLRAIRAAIRANQAAPNVFGSVEPRRRRSDEEILQGIGADIAARLVEARTA